MEEVHNIVCPFCGCCCDDISITIDGGVVVAAKNACSLGRSKFLTYGTERLASPMVKVGEAREAVSLGLAVDRAAEILSSADYPMIHGFGCTTCETIAVGIELAEELGGALDNVTTECHGPTIEGVHEVGEVTCTLGTVKNRADLIIYWGCNPTHAHPRHMARYSSMSRGMFRKSRADRKLVVVDVRKTHTARLADEFIQVQPSMDYEVLTALRSLVKGHELEVDQVGGVLLERLEALADLMVGCSFGALFFGTGLTMSPGKHRNIEAALSLVRDLNSWTKFVTMPMRGHFNVTGANAVFTWQTGYPFALDFSRGYPRYNPGETSFVDIVQKAECDAALIVASDPVAHIPWGAARVLAEVPTITIDPRDTPTTELATVAIPSAYAGIEASGTTYRMDGVPLELRKLVAPPEGVLPDVEVLQMILRKVREGRR